MDANRSPAREVVFDTETTGIDPASGHRLVEIGLVELVGRVETGCTFHAYFNPGRSMPPEAEAIHGLSERFLSDKPCFAEQVDAMLAFMGDSPLIAHNARFDIGFLDNELQLCGRGPLGFDRVIDTLAIARARHPGAKHSLDALCTRYGVDRSHRVKHGALLDAQLLAQIYVELTGGRQIGLDLAAAFAGDGAEIISTAAIHVSARAVRSPRPHAATPAELERHAAFIARLEGALWEDAAV